jgi:hypothetical protein
MQFVPSLFYHTTAAALTLASQLAAQQHELTLTRHYEGLLLARESQGLTNDLTLTTNTSQALHRLSKNLRGLLRTMAGEYPDVLDDQSSSKDQHEEGELESTDVEPDFKALIEALAQENIEERDD